MPSGEEYLDKLLNDVSNGKVEEQPLEETDVVPAEEAGQIASEADQNMASGTELSGGDGDLEALLGAGGSMDDLLGTAGDMDALKKAAEDMNALMEAAEVTDMSMLPDSISAADRDVLLNVSGNADVAAAPEIIEDMPQIAEEVGAADIPEMTEGLTEADMDALLNGTGEMEMPEIPELSEMPEISEMTDGLADMDMDALLNGAGEPELPEKPEMPEISELSDSLADMDMDALLNAAGEAEISSQSEEAENSAETVLDIEADLAGILEEARAEEDLDVSEDIGMTEEEIEGILNANQNEGEQENASADEAGAQDDLMGLLMGADDSDLQDIHDLLQKSDNNEAVDADLISKMQEVPDVAEGAAAASGQENEESGMTERQKKAAEKKRLKEEKAAAKKKEKEEKAAAKKLAKEAKKSGKSGQAPVLQEENSAEKMEIEGTESTENSGQMDTGAAKETKSSEGTIMQDGMLLDEGLGLDMSDLDELLNFSGALNEKADSGAADKEGKKERTAPQGKKKLLDKILDFLTEEDDEEETAQKGTEDIPLSDENQQVLKEIDQEEGGKKGKKSKKEKKPKKDKKGKKGAEADAEGAENEESSEDKKKKKKPKKEKPPKEKVYVNPRDRVTVKKLMPILMTCVSLLAAVLILVNFGGDFILKQRAKKAYYEEDYGTCYQELYGKKLNESELVMFGKSECILRIRFWMREYELYAKEGDEAHALDSLIQSVHDYTALYHYAGNFNASGDISVIYSQMLEILQNKYGLTEEQALEIAGEPDDVEYTRKVYAIVDGQNFSSTGVQSSPIILPDMLPEEQLFPENNGGRIG